MATYTKQTSVPLWHYHCPECGISDRDTGHLHPTDAVYCEVCLEDRRYVKLRRWDSGADQTPESLSVGARLADC